MDKNFIAVSFLFIVDYLSIYLSSPEDMLINFREGEGRKRGGEKNVYVEEKH